ncbi:MAG: SoxR reducing system RseC family protein [Chlorobium sp.]|jgi:sigma-E factor negative regulatory protein RseC|uniref:SoxR reducing system RseC family protein n=1 Tax=Chlorobium sp. TaxID=1095 RepID=UPI001DA88C7F|nr:SoxR reducing system RseC family protein [Chlorobium sp.]MBN1278624.1 SoxR reducing system RseC family protein [Chlorobiaceae bacterium]MCF8216026.1 SoxR reducing system RseC family protein [Chlorobium sp.]MCF8270927.1 SoxR reducing system RseC family protein [Chlorobium sp.]MCF8287301.1 SoxR reducing system RseC family protein [Chlorobium sp.]MCF8291676.1 SoxR reducing system RseC family protein [Chlorobium sp.]
MYAKVITASNGKAEIQLICTDSTGEAMHCGACSMGQKSVNKGETVLAENGIGAESGDMVEYAIKEHGELKAATLLFMLPLAVLIIVLGVAGMAGIGLWQSFLAGTAALAATFIGLQMRLKNKTYYYISGIK